MPLGVWTLRKHSVIEKTQDDSRPEESLQTSGGPGTPEDGWRSTSPRPAQALQRSERIRGATREDASGSLEQGQPCPT